MSKMLSPLCKLCSGRGGFHVDADPVDILNGGFHVVYIDCPDCEGSGLERDSDDYESESIPNRRTNPVSE